MRHDETERLLDQSIDTLKGARATLEACRDALKDCCRELSDCRNELCLRCGKYKESHLGACDGCRWNDVHMKKWEV